MKFNLLPKEEKFFTLFIRQTENLKKGIAALQDMVNNYIDIEQKYKNIKEIEHEGDNLTHEIFSKSKTSFITPIDREDIHELASGLDDVLDCIEGTAGRLHFFKVKEPTPALRQLVDIIEKGVRQIHQAITHLEKIEHTEKFCQEINRLENQADEIGHKASSELFQEADSLEDLKELIKLKDIYRRLEVAADRCEDVANVIEGIQIKNA